MSALSIILAVSKPERASNTGLSTVMGVSSQPSPVSLPSKNIQLPEDRNSSYGCLWRKVVAGRGMKHEKTSRRVLMKRRPRPRMIQGSGRRGAMGMKTRIRTLKRLIPRINGESMGLDGLFRDTAQYILSLQTRVRVMQIMLGVLTPSDD